METVCRQTDDKPRTKVYFFIFTKSAKKTIKFKPNKTFLEIKYD